MVKCQFEEKQFENALLTDLARAHRIYVPGQVLEHTLGFDAAVFSSHPDLRAALGAVPTTGTSINTAWWPLSALDPDTFPEFKVNLFLQHKRPDRMRNSKAAEWATWRQPYFRFDLVHQQQVALEALSESTGDLAIVAYSCPAFWQLSELWGAIEQREVVNRTHFVQAQHLSTHERYSFVSARRFGQAFSEPLEVPFLDLGAAASHARSLTRGISSNAEFLERLSEHVELAMATSRQRGALRLFEMYSRYTGRQGQTGTPSHLPRSHHALQRIEAFLFVTGTTWLIGI